MPEEKLYVGTKLIKAVPMSKREFATMQGKGYPENADDIAGYKVTYPDEYVSWSPASEFERAYREVSQSERELF